MNYTPIKQREIKFRWWNGKRMIPSHHLDVLARNMRSKDIKKDHFMQYIGLDDSLEIEIYESDVITLQIDDDIQFESMCGSWGYAVWECVITGYVDYKDGGFVFVTCNSVGDLCYRAMMDFAQHRKQVIGNRHQ